MTGDDNAFGELIQDYIVECLPLAEQIVDAFVELERRWREGTPSEEMLPAVKGWLHTVKGNSAMMGLVPAQDVAHGLEDVCATLAGDAGLRNDETAALLIEGGGMLVELVRGAGTAVESAAPPGFVGRVRAFLADLREGDRGPMAEAPAERRRVDRRAGGERAVELATGVVRVDFRRLDTLLEVLGEGLIQQATLADAYRRLARSPVAPEALGEMEVAILALEKTLKRLEGAVMETRLLPIATVVGRFPRLVRDLAHAEQKRVRLATTGGETPLDKAVLDRLGEPLIHLLNNAVVHGIETPDERVRAGKPAEAVLELQATSVSNRVILRLADDGRGLDEAKIQAKAHAMGMDVRSATAPELQRLIFLPGLSTADAVSTLAGRGVGLDVVAEAIHGLGGTIEVESRPGRGVTFTMSLPLTLAIVRSLIVEVDRERYAVPLTHVAETVRAVPEAIREINHRGVTRWRGHLIHVADGGAMLGTASASASASASAATPRPYFVVISAGAKRRGLLVDRLVGHQDVVVKSLDPACGRPDLVLGTTILGDGRVACILDAVRILDRAAPEPDQRGPATRGRHAVG